MAKTILEELEALIGKEAAAKVAAKSDIATRIAEGERLYRFYTGEEDVDPGLEDKKPVTTPVTETTPVTTTTPTTPTTTPITDTKSILSELSSLLTTRFDEFKKTVVTTDRLPALEGEVLTKALKLSHDIARIESNHEKEFGEQLDLDKFNGWYEEQKKAGASYGTIAKAYDSWVGDRRVEVKIQKGIADGLKQKQSADGVPAQTTSVALSPAQQVLHDARKTSAADGKSNAVRAAERLAQLQREREGSAA